MNRVESLTVVDLQQQGFNQGEINRLKFLKWRIQTGNLDTKFDQHGETIIPPSILNDTIPNSLALSTIPTKPERDFRNMNDLINHMQRQYIKIIPQLLGDSKMEWVDSGKLPNGKDVKSGQRSFQHQDNNYLISLRQVEGKYDPITVQYTHGGPLEDQIMTEKGVFMANGTFNYTQYLEQSRQVLQQCTTDYNDTNLPPDHLLQQSQNLLNMYTEFVNYENV